MLRFPSNIAQNKKDIRLFCKKNRETLYLSGELDRISDLITDRVINSDIFKNAKNVMLYFPLKKEINLLKITKDKDKNFYFPKCDEENILVCPNCARFAKNKYSIPEPQSTPIDDLSILDIILTPALSADLSFRRLGYGGGYYDRFFKSKNLRAKKAIVISEELLTKKLPEDKFDVKCDIIISEDRTLIRE